MIAARRHVTTPAGSVAPPMNPAVALMEGAHLAGIMSLVTFEAWLGTLAESMTLTHNVALAAMGVHPSQHAAPWDQLTKPTGTGWFEAMDKVLKAMGD